MEKGWDLHCFKGANEKDKVKCTCIIDEIMIICHKLSQLLYQIIIPNPIIDIK